MGNEKSKESPRKKRTIDTKVEFFQFLRQSDNYSAFCSYLRYRQGIENILFLEKITAIYHIILKYKLLYNASCLNNRGETEENDIIQSNIITEIIHLKYLREIYGEYDNKIKQLCEHYPNRNVRNLYDIKNYKLAFTTICKQIYDEFISDGANYQINISYENKQNLETILDSDSTCNQLNSFNDYLYLFNDINYEIYDLLISMYDYRFQYFISNHFQSNSE